MQQTIPVNDGYKSSHVGSTSSTGPFDVDFPFFSLNDVVVSREADGTGIPEPLIRGADYDLVGVATEDGSFSSGTITLYIAVANTTVVRFRTTPVERLSNFPLQGFFSRLALNAELNKITVWMQELNGLLGTTSEASQAHAPIVSPLFVGDPRAPTPLPGDNDQSLATTAFVNTAMVGVGAAVPTGVLVDFAGAVAPPGWLLCVGQTLNRVAYAPLFGVLGTTYNLGGEAGTDFRLPDLRGRVTAVPDSGGSNRLSGQIANSDVVGSAGGLETHTLTAAQVPVHAHSMQNHTHFGSSGYSFVYTNAGAFLSWLGGEPGPNWIGYNPTSGGPSNFGDTSSAGGGTAHPNVQPTFIMHKIIKI